MQQYLMVLISALNIIIPVSIVFLLIFIIGIIVSFFPDFKAFAAFVSRGLRNSISEQKARKKKESELDKELRLLIASTIGNKVTVQQFKIFTVFLYIVALVLTGRVMSIAMGILISLVIAVAPYAILRYLLQRGRNKGAGEAEKLIQTLLLEYRASNFNMIETLDSLTDSLNDTPVTRRLIFNLTMRAKTAHGNTEIKEATSEFAYAIGTSWSRMLANNLYRALTDGGNVSESIEDILLQLKNARVLTEERKRINAESVRLLAIIPIAYVVLIFLSSKIGVPAEEFLKSQFTTVEGLLFFGVIVILTAISGLLVSITQGKKFDF